jgi:hypothetical protein
MALGNISPGEYTLRAKTLTGPKNFDGPNGFACRRKQMLGLDHQSQAFHQQMN